MNKKVIYTCLVGNYDSLLQPCCISEEFDYVCFSNEIEESKVGIWHIRKIPFEHKDKTRLSRYVKINPHLVFPNYDFSIWVDANIQIVDATIYKRVKELEENNILIAQVKHSFHHCIYDDLYKCLADGKDKLKLLVSQYNFLKKEKFPSQFGLYENNLIYRKHNEKRVVEISDLWWKIYMDYSKRDQLSLCYVYWKKNYLPELLFPLTINARNCEGLKYYKHKLFPLKKRIVLNFRSLRNKILLRVAKTYLLRS